MWSNDSDTSSLENNKEVFLKDDQPFESPAAEFVPGPYYASIDERLPELGDEAASEPLATLSQSESDAEKSKLAVDRRDFMRLFSASAMMASVSCVRRPVEWAVPYVDQPVDHAIGQPIYYATTIDYAGVMVKTVSGYPVYIEGSPTHPLSQGTASQFAMSELQTLYHPDRRKAPQIKFGVNRISDVEWQEVYQKLGSDLKSAKKIGILGTAYHGFE